MGVALAALYATRCDRHGPQHPEQDRYSTRRTTVKSFLICVRLDQNTARAMLNAVAEAYLFSRRVIQRPLHAIRDVRAETRSERTIQYRLSSVSTADPRNTIATPLRVRKTAQSDVESYGSASSRVCSLRSRNSPRVRS